MIIGLTGGIATGKSTVVNMIKKIGISIVDADVIARSVVAQGEKAYEEIVSYFGNDVKDSTGEIDRKKLGSLVFSDDTKRHVLNSIVHPEIRKRIMKEISFLTSSGVSHIIIDVPLLFEANYTSIVDKILTIYVDEDIQLERLKKRDGFSTEESLARINAQMPLSEKVKESDAIIDNNGQLKETYDQLVRILKEWNCL